MANGSIGKCNNFLIPPGDEKTFLSNIKFLLAKSALNPVTTIFSFL
jgi:hypothetical protein